MWKHEENVFSYISENFVYNAAVSIFSFNNTLIKGNIPKHTDHKKIVELFHSNVPSFLKRIHENDGSIIIIENQFNTTHESIKYIFNKFLKFIPDVPIMAFFILKKNKYRKPNTNIWLKIGNLYRSANHEIINKENIDNQGIIKTLDLIEEYIDVESSLIIGANAGRTKCYLYPADYSDCDRAFAENINISTFRTPEMVFLRGQQDSRKWQWSKYIMSIDERRGLIDTQPSISSEPTFEQFVAKPNMFNIILISGSPCSGKTILSNRLRIALNTGIQNIIVIDINNFSKGRSEMFSYLEELLLKNTTPRYFIFVDCLPNNYERNWFIDKIYEILNVCQIDIDDINHVKYIEIGANVPQRVVWFLNKFKLQITCSWQLTELTLHHFNQYYSEYQLPVFSDKKISICEYPLIIRPREEFWYRYS